MEIEYKGDFGLYLSGAQVPIKACGIYITPMTVRQVVQHGEDEFFTQVKMLSDISLITKSLKEGKSQVDGRNDFQILLGVLADPRGVEIKQSIIDALGTICPDFDVECDRRAINFFVTLDEEAAKPVRVGQINPFNYELFAKTVNDLFLPQRPDEDIEYNINESSRASRQLMEKIKRNRERLKQAASSKSGGGTSLLAQQASILSLGTGLDINTIMSYTLFQLYDAFDRYMLKSSYEMYRQMCMIPFSDPSKLDEPESWLVNLYDPARLEGKRRNTNTMSAFRQVTGGAK